MAYFGRVQSTGSNLLEMVPRRTRPWDENADGLVTILEPRFGRSAIGRWLAARIRPKPIGIRLDELGSAVWRSCDGTTTVARIADDLKRQYGDRIEPVRERLARFLQHLERTRFIRWDGMSEPRITGEGERR